MKRSVSIVLACAIAGFVLPIAMLIYHAVSQTMAGSLDIMLCPACIASMALDNASTSTAIFVWLVICLSNALLYSLPIAAILFLVISIRRQFRNAQSTD